MTSMRSVVNYQSVSRNATLQRPKLFINDRQVVDDWNELDSSTLPKSLYADPTLAHSRETLASPRRDIDRPATALDSAKVAPEILDISKSNGTYRVQMNLNANFCDPSMRPASALPALPALPDSMMTLENKYTSVQKDILDYEYRRPASVANHFSAGYPSDTWNNHRSTVYNVNGASSASDYLRHANTSTANTFSRTYPLKSQQRNANSTTVVNVDATKNPAIRSSDRTNDDEFFIKSVRSTESTATQNNQQEDDEVKLDLRLFAKTVVTESAPIVESETIKIEPSRKKAAAKKSRRSARAVDEDVTDDWAGHRGTTGRSQFREIPQELEVESRQRSNAMTEAIEKETIQKSCNTDPEVTSIAVQTINISNSAVQTDLEPERPVIERELTSRSALRRLDDEWDVYDSPPLPPLPPLPPSPPLLPPPPKIRETRSARVFDVPDYETAENHYVQSIGFARLLEGAPRGSFRKKMDVRKEDDQIVGPLPKEEVDRMYTNSMINVDSVSEKVELTLVNGIAQLVVKITYERIVPIEDSQDTFKKSAVVVTKNIDVDLNATEERRKMYEHILESHKNGRLDNKYTFELYKAFIALSEEEEGANQEHSSIEKKVDEEKLWNMNSGSSESGEQQVNLKILENKLSDFSKQSTTTSMTYRPSTSETVRSLHQRDVGESVHSEGSKSFVWKSSGAQQSTIEPTDSHEHAENDAKGSVASYQRMLSQEFLKKNSSDNWKSIFNDWTEEAAKVTQKLTGHSSQRTLAPRMNALQYLRPGGNRTRNMVTKSMEATEWENINLETSDAILANVGIQPGSHRHRMSSYQRVLDDNGSVLVD